MRGASRNGAAGGASPGEPAARGGDGRARLRVLVVGPTPPPYHGGAVATRYLLEGGLGDDLELIHLDTSDRRDLRNIGRLDATNVALALRHGVTCLWLLVRRRPAVVYVPVAQNRLGFLRDALFLLGALALRRAVVLHVHGGHFRAFYDGTDPLTRAVARLVVRRATRVVVLGEGLRAMFRGLLPEARVVVVPNGTPRATSAASGRAEGAAPAPRESTAAAASRPGDAAPRRGRQVLYLGALLRTKGVLDVLAAARLVAARRPDVRFVFAGGAYGPGDEEALLRAAAAELPETIECRGVVAGAAKRRALEESDIFVLPTYYPYEGHPYVIIEAMEAGLPVVATAHGAIAECVADGETGVIVPARSPEILAETLVRLLDDDALRERMGRAARAAYARSYTLEHWTARMAEVLRAAGSGA
ncbi:MAG TPA: glycosyltransferase family 4 protein [Longimicrobiales bacterium]|nr:glycosyltransferase family 4 protein [Longimicrobiales bacterium]